MNRFATKAEALEYAEENGTRCLMAREVIKNIYEFWCFEGYTAFRKFAIANVDDLGLFWHEEFPRDKARVPFFDIDLEGDEEFDMDKTERRIARALRRECEFIWTDFSREGREGKTSFHGICLAEETDGEYFGFSGSQAQREFNLSIADKIDGLDVACVNRIRCVGNAKREFVDEYPWDLEAFRNGKSSLIGRYPVHVGEESVSAPSRCVGYVGSIDIYRALEEFAIEKYGNVNWDASMKIMRLYGERDCSFCKREHDGEQLYLKLGARGRVFLNCFRAGGKGTYEGTIRSRVEDE